MKNKNEPLSLTSPWTYIKIPEKGEFVLIAYGPYLDAPEEIGRSRELTELMKKVQATKMQYLSYLRIFDHNKEKIWDANLPTTMEQNGR